MVNADLECLESDLIAADEKLTKLKALKNRGTFQEFVEDLIQDFEVSGIFFGYFFLQIFVKFILKWIVFNQIRLFDQNEILSE